MVPMLLHAHAGKAGKRADAPVIAKKFRLCISEPLGVQFKRVNFGARLSVAKPESTVLQIDQPRLSIAVRTFIQHRVDRVCKATPCRQA